jgi:hypothetical protein
MEGAELMEVDGMVNVLCWGAIGMLIIEHRRGTFKRSDTPRR